MGMPSAEKRSEGYEIFLVVGASILKKIGGTSYDITRVGKKYKEMIAQRRKSTDLEKKKKGQRCRCLDATARKREND